MRFLGAFLVFVATLFCLCSLCRGQLADEASVRCTVGNVCGSGTIVGADSENGYVLTNAHVVGTSVGRDVGVDVTVGGARVRVSAKIIWAAYSSASNADVAILAAPQLSCRSYSPMSILEPNFVPFTTRGSPRCVWPLVSKPFMNPRISTDSALLWGDPDAIGGQSGSGIFNKDRVTVGLVTWSWNGRCAGQQTRSIHSILRGETLVSLGVRPSGLIELPAESERSRTEDGVFAIVGRSPLDLPIWSTPTPPGAPSCVELTPLENQIILLMRSRPDIVEVIDWASLIRLILQILSLFNTDRTT